MFFTDQAVAGAASCLLSAVLVSLAPICAVERAGSKSQWQSSVSQCVYDAHDQVIFGSSSIDIIQLLTPAYNALALVLFFTGVSYNVASKLLNRHKISADEYVGLGTYNTENTELTTPGDDTFDVTEEADDTHLKYPLLSSKMNKAVKADTAADALDRARERVSFIGVVLASQSYSFLLVCIFAVFIDKWWVDV